MAIEASQSNTSARSPRLIHRLDAWGAAFLVAVFGLLPLDCASALGGALARRIGPFLGISKRARLNLRRAFPELSQTEIMRVAGRWDNLGRVAAEYPTSGKSVCRPRSSGSTARTSGSPSSRRSPWPPIGDSHADAAALMAQVNAILERWIRDRPEQWFWVHQRWPD
jgi:lauroyl/myristoyl acyltransferase